LVRVVKVKLCFGFFTFTTRPSEVSITPDPAVTMKLDDPDVARSDVKAKKNHLPLLDREPPLLGKGSDPWHRPHWEWEILLKRVFSYFCEGPFGIERVSIEVCTDRGTMLPYRI
jgi:hypothetical protein